MALNDVYRASAIFTHPQGDGDLVFTRHYRTTTVATVVSGVVEAQEIATEYVNNVETQYLPHLPEDYTFVEMNVIGITDPTVTTTLASGLPGLIDGDAVAIRSAPVIKLGTGLRGRSFNGRMFLMAPPEANQDGGVITPAYVTLLEGFLGFILRLSVTVSNNIYDSTIYSPTLSLAQETIVDTLITTQIVNSTMGSQRGRQKV